MLKILLITFILLGLAFAGLGIKLLLDRKAVFRGSSCKALEDLSCAQGISCGCEKTHIDPDN
jgi:hypothetical protein